MAKITFAEIHFESLSEFILRLPIMTHSDAEVIEDFRTAASSIGTLAESHGPPVAIIVAIDAEGNDGGGLAWLNKLCRFAQPLDETLASLLRDRSTRGIHVNITGMNLCKDDIQRHVQNIFPSAFALKPDLYRRN